MGRIAYWLLVIALLGAAPASAAGVAAGDDSRLLPLDAGNRWTYVFVRERSRRKDRGEPVVEHLRGTLIEEVAGLAPSYGQGVVERRSLLQGRSEGDPTNTIERRRDFVSTDGRHLTVLAREAPQPLRDGNELVRFDPPLLAVRGDMQAGSKWTVGEHRWGGIQTETRGEILGVQDATTPMGLFEMCLVVQRTSSSKGRLDTYDSEVELRSGTVTTTEWYAPGVGLVLSKRDTAQTMLLEDGSVVEFEEHVQFALSALSETQRAGSADPAPASLATENPARGVQNADGPAGSAGVKPSPQP